MMMMMVMMGEGWGSIKGPMWGHPVPVLGAISPFLEPFRGRLSPNIDNFSEKLTLRYPHEGPWVAHREEYSLHW